MWSVLTIIKPALMSALYLTQGYHIIYICPNIIFQTFSPCSRPMTSHHVTCHVTMVSYASSLSKRKEKEKKKKINIKSENKRKIQIVSVQTSHNK